MNIRLTLILAAMIGLGGVTAVYLWPGNANLKTALSHHGLSFKLESFKVSRESAQTVKSMNVVELLANAGSSEIQIRIVHDGRASFAHYTSQRQFQILSQFTRSASPYPGAASAETECPPDFIPKVEPAAGPGWSGTWLRTFANPRKLLGVCRTDERHFTVANLIILCETSGSMFDFTLFAAPGDEGMVDMLKEISCGSGGAPK